ncbi:MAG: hypothetical protein V4692_03445 [Bdellovibrionota bacterium]
MSKFSGILGFVVLVFGGLTAHSAETDWSQPPLLCVEDIVPKVPSRPCLDLSKVAEPAKEWPVDLPPEELAFWQRQKFGMGYCRSEEILRREAAAPGSMKPSAVEVSWMRMTAVRNHDLKVKAVYDAALAYKIPPHVLTGALFQESLFSDLSIADDGGNFSCGVAQINLSEWCNWANKQSSDKKRQMGWPTSAISCGTVANKAQIKPFYDIAVSRLKDLPTYRLQAEHFANISFEQVVAGFPAGTDDIQKLRYQTATSFIRNCGTPTDAIMAKANELNLLYTQFVPAGLKQNETYSRKDRNQMACLRESNAKTYPLHTGWVLAVGAYNAGPRAVDIMAANKKWTRDQVSRAETFSGFNPKQLVSSIYKAGVYNAAIDAIEMNDLSGRAITVKWMKMCVLQRHVARVVQHTTQPLIPPLADTLEGTFGCGTFPGDSYRERAGLEIF